MIFNIQKDDAVKKAGELVIWGRDNGVDFLPPKSAATAPDHCGTCGEEWGGSVEFAVVLGGDGTFLRAARYTLGHNIPLYGINLGRLGFLAVGSPESAEEDIKSILFGKFSLQKRHLVKGLLWRGGKVIAEMRALNDLIISNGCPARVIDLEVRTGNDQLMYLIGDGLIVSSPTGSTAYSLSAGGPIVPPHLPCMLLSPICPHSLYSRPIVLGDSDKVYILPKGDVGNMTITQDGQLGQSLESGDVVEAALDASQFVNTILPENRSYYDLLREKLSWGRNGINYGGKRA